MNSMSPRVTAVVYVLSISWIDMVVGGIIKNVYRCGPAQQ